MALRRNRRDAAHSRRSGILPGRRFAVGTLVAVATLASATSLAAAASSTIVADLTIYDPGGPTDDPVTLGALQANPQGHCAQYGSSSIEQYDSSGQNNPARLAPAGPITGTWTVGSILACAQTPVSLGDVTGVTTLRQGAPQIGANARLTPRDLQAPTSDFHTDTEYPVVAVGGPQTFDYYRPWRGGSDANGNDNIDANSGIALQVFEGPALTVQINGATTATAGSPVSFSATVSGGAGGTPTYTWGFQDNLPGSQQASPQVTYADAGTYDVTLQVISPDGGEGVATVPITVSGAAQSTTTPTTPTSPTGPTNGSGQNPSGGNTPGGGSGGSRSKGNHTGTKSGGGKPTHSTPAKSTPTHTSSPGNQSQQSNTQTTTSTTTTPTTSSTSSSTSAAGGSDTTPAAGPTPTPTPTSTSTSTTSSTTHPRSRRTARRKRRNPSAGTVPEVVTGRLIADVTPLSQNRSPFVQRIVPPASAAQGARVAPDGSSPVGVIAGVAGVLALLALGAWRELDRPLRIALPARLRPQRSDD